MKSWEGMYALYRRMFALAFQVWTNVFLVFNMQRIRDCAQLAGWNKPAGEIDDRTPVPCVSSVAKHGSVVKGRACRESGDEARG